MTHQAPGKSDREGITLVELCDMFRPRKVRGNGSRPAYGPTGGIAHSAVAPGPMRRATITCPIGARIAGHISPSRPRP